MVTLKRIDLLGEDFPFPSGQTELRCLSMIANTRYWRIIRTTRAGLISIFKLSEAKTIFKSSFWQNFVVTLLDISYPPSHQQHFYNPGGASLLNGY